MKNSLNHPWILKYSPKSVPDIVGQKKQIKKIIDVIDKKSRKKAAFLYGPTGSGKTSSIYAIAKDYDLELVEINASDSRKKAVINSLLGSVAMQQSLFAKGKIILIDEVDGISGRKDRGAVPAIKKIIKETSYPVILVANDVNIDKLKSLKKISELIEFDLLNSHEVFGFLRNICEKENIEYDESLLKTLARSCNGDLRAAINDLQIFSSDGKFDPKSADFLIERAQKENIKKALFKVFKTFKPKVSLSSYNTVDMNLDEIMNWIEYNTPKEYKNIKDLASAFDCISLADVFKGRIRRWQYWRFLVYINQLLSVGISLAKDKKYSGLIDYSRSKKGLRIWQYNMKTAKKKSIAKKFAEKTHLSLKQAFKYVDGLKPMMKNPALRNDLINEFEFDDSEIVWLEK